MSSTGSWFCRSNISVPGGAGFPDGQNGIKAGFSKRASLEKSEKSGMSPSPFHLRNLTLFGSGIRNDSVSAGGAGLTGPAPSGAGSGKSPCPAGSPDAASNDLACLLAGPASVKSFDCCLKVQERRIYLRIGVQTH